MATSPTVELAAAAGRAEINMEACEEEPSPADGKPAIGSMRHALAPDDEFSRFKSYKTSEESRAFATHALNYNQACGALAAAALEAAAQEELPLLRSDNLTGFKGVALKVEQPGKPFKAYVDKAKAYLGCFRTAEEAALAYSRYVGKAALLEMLAAEKAASNSLSEEQVRRMAADEGLELVADLDNSTGFRGVQYNERIPNRPYTARHTSRGHSKYLGWFATKHEAALAYARSLGRDWFLAKAERAAEKAAAAEAKSAAAEARMEKRRREEAAKMARPKKQRLGKEEAMARKEEVMARKEEAMARKEEARVRAKAERAALQAALQEHQRQQAEHQRRLLQEAATAQRERQATGSGGASSSAAAAVGNAARAPLVDADGPIDDLVAMVLAGAAPTLDPSSCLGLPPASGREQARKRYRQLALRLHPDKCDHPSADEAFKRIEEAWRFIEAGADDPV